jgi:hypothetical protein
METPVSTDVDEWSELDGLETVPYINKNKLAVIQPSKIRNTPVRKTGTRDAWHCHLKNYRTPISTGSQTFKRSIHKEH